MRLGTPVSLTRRSRQRPARRSWRATGTHAPATRRAVDMTAKRPQTGAVEFGVRQTMSGVRDASLADAHTIATIQVNGWLAAYRGLVPDALLDELSVAKAAEKVEAAFRSGRGHVLVAQDRQGVVRGFCWSLPARDGSLATHAVEMVALYVDPLALRQGFGRSLLEATCERAAAQRASRVVLWVFRQNLPARRFYTALGFTPDGSEKTTTRWGGVPLDEIRYARALGV